MKSSLLLPALPLLLSAAPAQPAWVKLYSNGVEYLQWTEIGGTLKGTHQLVYTEGTPPRVRVSTETFTGKRAGNAVTLTLGNAWTGVRVWNGTLKGATLNVSAPKSGGGVNTLAFQKTTPQQYDKVVNALRDAATQEARRYEQQQAREQAEQEASDRQRRAVLMAADGVGEVMGDAAQLAGNLNDRAEEVQSALVDLGSALQDMKGALGDLDQAAGEARADLSCYNVERVQGYFLERLSGYFMDRITGYFGERVDDRMQTLREKTEAFGGVLENVVRAPGAYTKVLRANPRVKDAPPFPESRAAQAERELRAAYQSAVKVLADANARRKAVLLTAQGYVQAGRRTAAALSCKAGE